MAFLSKYAVARHIYIPLIKRAVVDFAVSADWTPAAGDVKISKDGGAAANVTNLPTAITMGNAAMWDFSLSSTEMTAAQVLVTISDSATKAVEDQQFDIETYGNASAQHAFDLGTAMSGQAVSSVTGAVGSVTGAVGSVTGAVGSVTGAVGSVTGAVGSVTGAVGSVTGNVGGSVAGSVASVTGNVGGNVVGSVASVTAAVTISAGTGAGQLDFTSGVIKANLAQILGTALTETAGQIAAAFKKFFNIATPASTMDHLTLLDTVTTATTATTATNLTNAPTAGDFTATMKTSIGTAVAASAVASVTGNVGGNVTGSVGSVSGNVGGNVTGSVGSVTGLTASNLDTTVSSRATPANILTTALTESYAGDGVAPTLSQSLFAIQQFLQERGVAGTTLTVNKLDGTTAAMTFTLNDGTAPTAITRAT